MTGGRGWSESAAADGFRPPGLPFGPAPATQLLGCTLYHVPCQPPTGRAVAVCLQSSGL